MTTRTTLHRSATLVVAAALLLVQQTAQACEGCKQQVGMGDGANGSRVVNSVGLGYAVSITMLLCMVAGAVALLGTIAYRNCQIIAAHQRAMLAAEEAAAGGLEA